MVGSGDTYTSNGAAEMIKEIMAYLKEDGLGIIFRMEGGSFDDDTLETIQAFGCAYVIKGKIIRTARNVRMKLSEKYPHREIYEQSLS
jgi:hypothetical protein